MPGKTYKFKDLNAVVDGEEAMVDVTPEPREKPPTRLEMNALRKKQAEEDALHHDVPRLV